MLAFTGVVFDSGAAIALIVAIGIKSVGSLARKLAESQKSTHIICSSISITDTGVAARGEPPFDTQGVTLGPQCVALHTQGAAAGLRRFGLSGRMVDFDFTS